VQIRVRIIARIPPGAESNPARPERETAIDARCIFADFRRKE
jgi:hypothetical protein